MTPVRRTPLLAAACCTILLASPVETGWADDFGFANEAGRVRCADQDPKTEENAQTEKASDPEATIDTWVKHAMPGEHHRVLDKMVGKWKTAIKYRMRADTPVVESQGEATRTWILGKRFLLEEFDGGSLGLPFEAQALYGYDTFEKKFTSAWVDTMGSAITTNLGTCNDDCSVITFVGRHGDPWTGVKRHSRGVTRFISDDKHVLELYEPGSDGKEFKILEITYTRK